MSYEKCVEEVYPPCPPSDTNTQSAYASGFCECQDACSAIARQADAEVERLRGELEKLRKEYGDFKVAVQTTTTNDLYELGKIRDASGTEDPIALIEAGKKLPRTKDGVRVVPIVDDVYSLKAGRITLCHVIEHYDSEGWIAKSIPWGTNFSACMDECYSTEQLAREAKEKGDA